VDGCENILQCHKLFNALNIININYVFLIKKLRFRLQLNPNSLTRYFIEKQIENKDELQNNSLIELTIFSHLIPREKIGKI
jgi:hypothetical protein